MTLREEKPKRRKKPPHAKKSVQEANPVHTEKSLIKKDVERWSGSYGDLLCSKVRRV